MTRKRRRQNGNMIVLIVLVMFLILVPLLILISQAGLLSVDRGRIQNAVDAAGLVAANDISRIVINDPAFGFVSLSNYPAVGEATVASDGEPLPVTGINTLVGTIRQNTIVASELGNETMISLVDLDRLRLEGTIAMLNETLTQSLKTGDKRKLFDIHGKEVIPLKDVASFMSSSLPEKVQLESITLTNGWVASETGTETPLPQPDLLAQVKPSQRMQRQYRGFVEVPACGRSFTFAGLNATSRMVPPEMFHQADKDHICSIVRVDCVVRWRNKTLLPFGSNAFSRARFVSCCEPYCLPDSAPSGVMVVHFSGPPAPGLLYWSDFLRSTNFHDRLVSEYLSYGGDFPTDRDARLYRYRPEQQTTAQQFAEHFYHWLREAHVRPRIDSVLGLMNEQFRSNGRDILAYDFTGDGTICSWSMNKDPFPLGVTCDSQSSAVCDTAIQGGCSPIIIFRDNVKQFGTINGGKHGGQPLAGDPEDWFHSPQQGGQLSLAMMPVKRSAGLRKSCDSGGLAVEIEIGGISPSTAAIDVARMRKLKR